MKDMLFGHHRGVRSTVVGVYSEGSVGERSTLRDLLCEVYVV